MSGKSVIFFVHGVGNHEPGWSKDELDGPEAALIKASEEYPERFDGDNSLANSAKFIEIHYNHIFERVREDWNKLAASLTNAKFPSATSGAIDTASGLLQNATKEDQLFGTHALDAILYKNPLIRQIVRHSVASQLARGIADNRNAKSYSMVAHSLGTAVAHDSLQLLGNARWMKYSGKMPEGVSGEQFREWADRIGGNPFAPTRMRWAAFYMIANVAMMFHAPKPDSPDTIVRPTPSADETKCLARRYFNFSHVLDPIALASPFHSIEAWPSTAALGRCADINTLRHIHNANVHGFAHYIAHPYVHGRIFRYGVPGRFDAKHLAEADARAASGGDFPRLSSKLADDDLRAAFIERLEPLLNNAGQTTFDAGLLKELFEKLGPMFRS